MAKFNTSVLGSGQVFVGDNTVINITRKGTTEVKLKTEDKTPTRPTEETNSSEACKVIDEQFSSFQYKIKTGYALIINNMNYTQRSEPLRWGSDKDAKQVKEFFEMAGFQPIRMEENVDQNKLLKILDELSEKDYRRYDAFACVILSHGGEKGIACVDEKFVPMEIITSKFIGEHCPSLFGKPKMFFVQACRGKLLDHASIQTDATLTDAPLPRMPSDSDFLVVYSCAPGYQSLRHKELGSWFIHQLVKVFNEFAHEEHLGDMILRLNYLIANMKSDGEEWKQTSSHFSTLAKKVYFTVPHPSNV